MTDDTNTELHDSLVDAAELQDQRQKADFQALVECRGWPAYVVVYESKIQDLMRKLLLPLGHPEGSLNALSQEYAKGALAAYQEMLALPKNAVEGAQMGIDAREALLAVTDDEPELNFDEEID